MRARRRVRGVAVLVSGALAVWLSVTMRAAAVDLPARLSDQELWSLIERVSEPSGYFRSDNLVSDEQIFADVVPDLLRRPRTSGVYLGVGPEQNFTYIAAIEPRMAFVIDIRRGNLHLQLLYKALFELSADRADFLSRLFCKPRPAGLTRASTADALLSAYWNVDSSDAATYRQNLAAVKDLLVAKHGFPLSEDDLRGIEYVYDNFYFFGPSIRWDTSSGAGRSSLPTFGDLVRQADANGRGLSFLATEARFSIVKNLEAANLIVPVVGNFAGPKAVRAVGQYVRDHGAVVSAFYVSEVEPYLVQDGIWRAFCANTATLPVDDASTFIRPALSAFGLTAPARPGVEPTFGVALEGAVVKVLDGGPRATLSPIAAETRPCRVPGRAPADLR